MANEYEPRIIEAGVYSAEAINEEFQKIKAALDDLLSRIPEEGRANAMFTHLDMGEFRVLNLPEPTEPTDVVRVIDILEGPIFEKIIEALIARGYQLPDV